MTYPIKVSFIVEDHIDAYFLGQAFALLMHVEQAPKFQEPTLIEERRKQFAARVQEALFKGEYEGG
jgi:hypothetical protein